MITDSTWRSDRLGERVTSGIADDFGYLGGFSRLWLHWNPEFKRLRALAEEGRDPFEGAFAHLTEPPAIDPRPIGEQIAAIADYYFYGTRKKNRVKVKP